MARRDADVPAEDIVATAKSERDKRRGLFARIALFLRQVMNELSKVVTPTRKELLTYTGVVLVFVVIVMSLVSGFDFLFGLGVSYVFGNGPIPTAP